jgi:hypothetical protein
MLPKADCNPSSDKLITCFCMVHSPETSVDFQRITRQYVSEGETLLTFWIYNKNFIGNIPSTKRFLKQ